MSKLPKGFNFGDGAYCFPQGMNYSARFSYIPGEPRVDIPPMSGGRPAASLTNSSDAAVLSIQAVWDLSADDLAMLKTKIAKRYPDAGTQPIGIAQLDEVTASLTIGSGVSGETIGPQQTSGMEPYRAVIQATLPSDKKSGAVDAFNGQSGVLKLTHHANFKLNEQVKVRVKGDLAAALKALAPEPDESVEEDDGSGWFSRRKKRKHKQPTPKKEPATLEDCLEQLNKAIENGDVKEIVEATPNAPDELKQSVSSKLRDMIAEHLLRTLQQLGESAVAMTNFDIDQSQEGAETQTYTIERSADLGDFFATHDGTSLIFKASDPIPSPP